MLKVMHFYIKTTTDMPCHYMYPCGKEIYSFGRPLTSFGQHYCKHIFPSLCTIPAFKLRNAFSLYYVSRITPTPSVMKFPNLVEPSLSIINENLVLKILSETTHFDNIPSMTKLTSITPARVRTCPQYPWHITRSEKTGRPFG